MLKGELFALHDPINHPVTTVLCKSIKDCMNDGVQSWKCYAILAVSRYARWRDEVEWMNWMNQSNSPLFHIFRLVSDK